MKVSSPIGDFPFEARRLRFKDGSLVVEGAMGAWPATVQVEPADLPMLLRLVPVPVLALVVSLAGVVLLRWIRRTP